ncbi:ABC-type transport system involved in resistance to organic solvents, auxiliary component [uncultured Woeseiaceae bacterium]|uniref:ABC-type transport system involved in resistance to organic solvents, auxiliary component n=1 Tax=uncultured Woeseiaceae bacterium TaxID=1983305 RepID=A0A7D9H3Q9_9GAMM|nr:ABC-type transport system involved in resistance to organic solvents, auxiliary component [uncultured Woeseiaceae bacterium]
MKRIILASIIGLTTCGAMAESPNDVVQAAADALEVALEGRKDELGKDPDALYAMVDDILLPIFDRRYAAQLVLGKHWRNASDDERGDFVDAFYGSLLRKYSDGVLQFNQSSLEILPFRGDDTKPRATVKTIVRLDNGTKVPVNYGVVKRESGWMMFDVTIEGISYVRNFRTELNAEIQTKGLRAVINRLNGTQSTASASE